MKSFSNPALLNLQALYIDNKDSHAQHGVHIRVSHNPLLGLPTMPFILQRADINEEAFQTLYKETNAIYHNQYNEELTPPFKVSKNDEITITLPSDSKHTAMWVELEVKSNLFKPNSPIFTSPFGGLELGRVDTYSNLSSATLGELHSNTHSSLHSPILELKRHTLRVTAYLQTVSENQEYALLGSRSKPPFAFSGTGIKKLIVRGEGTILGIQWLNAQQSQKYFLFKTIEMLNLPHKGGARYAEVPNWKAFCDMRRNRQAPKRLPLQDTLYAPTRFSAPLFSESQEDIRVETLFQGIKSPLDKLINHPTPQISQEIEHRIVDKDHNAISSDVNATMHINSLSLVLQSQLDPGVASYMGYKTFDDANIKSDIKLSVYRIVGFFNDPDINNELLDNFYFKLLYQKEANKSRITTNEAIKEFNGLLENGRVRTKHLLQEKNSFRLQGIAIADHRAPLDKIAPVSLRKPKHLNWLPSPIKHPIRSIETEISNLVATAGIAVKLRQSKNSHHWSNRNSIPDKADDRWHTLTIAGSYQLNANDLTTSQELQENFIADEEVGADDFRQYVAQMDRFGRYSEWANVIGDRGPRPKPPRPTVLASYQQPIITTGKHQGEVTATIPLPDESSLAPASFPLSYIELTVRSEGRIFGSPLSLPVSDKVLIQSENNQFGLRSTFLGPIIPATLSRELEIIAVWVDTQGQRSQPSEPVKLMMHDPYPPEQTPIEDTLEYTARPDVTKKAWVERQWINGGNHITYAVYYSDENRLLDYLRKVEEPWASELLIQLEEEKDLAIRASMLKAKNSKFPDYLYERLKDVIEYSDNQDTVAFRHALSGSLKVLSAYKIVAQSAGTTARPKLSDVDVVFYAVPNSEPPARPSISAKLITSESGEPTVKLTVTLRAGVTKGETVRIRRTRSGVIDSLTNPIIGSATFSEVDSHSGLQTATFLDTGAALIAPNARFAPFVNYAWIAEAQGVAESGSNGEIVGLWSQPSVPVTVDILTPKAPEAPRFDSQLGRRKEKGIENLLLKFTYPINLVSTSLGAWIIRVERTLPNEAMSLLSEKPANSGTEFIIQGDEENPNITIPYGTKYRVKIIDPIGRESSVVEHVVHV